MSDPTADGRSGAPRSSTGGEGRTHRPAPGAEAPRRYLPRLRYELISCGLHGHELVGTDAATVRPQDGLFVREEAGVRWYRCLRCDAWVALDAPAHPTRPTPPAAAEVVLPLRGRPLRDRFVLRAVALERLVHFLVLSALDAAIFLFAADRPSLRHLYTRVLADLQGGTGGPLFEGRSGVLSRLNELFTVSRIELYLLGLALALYCAVLLLEAVGLWVARRWAEYLTFVETSVLVPFEVYEMVNGVTTIKVIGLVLNLAILLYLAVAHRLFKIRGGERREREVHERDVGWDPIVAATPHSIVANARPQSRE